MSEPSAFIARLRQEIKDYVLGEMPPDPSGQLAQEGLADLLITYGNWRGRFVSQRPRQVHESAVLQASPKYGEHAQALAAIRADVHAGRDLTPRLSAGVKIAYEPPGQPSAQQRSRDLDRLLADWGIHHLHLGTTVRNGRVDRTADLLFVFFAREDAYLIDIRPHGSWAEMEIMRTLVRGWPNLAAAWELRSASGRAQSFSDADRAKMRNAGVAALLDIDGKVYVPGGAGQTTAGTPIAVTEHVNRLMHHLTRLEARFVETPDWLDQHVAPASSRTPGPPEWSPRVQDDQCGARERHSGTVVPFGPLTR